MPEGHPPETAVLEQLRSSEAAMQRFLDATPTALVRNSRDLRVLLINQAYARLIGREADEIVGRLLPDIVGADAFETVRPYIERVLSGESVEYEVELPFGTRTRWLHVIYTPDVGPAGDVIGWVASITDITTQKQTEHALRERHRLQRLLARAGSLGSSLSRSDDLIAAVSELVAIELGVSRCGLAQVDADAGQMVIEHDYTAGLPPLAGRYPLGRYVAQWKEYGVAGQAVMVQDTATDPRTAAQYAAAFAPIHVRSHLRVPLHRDGKWVASFWVSDHEPRAWTTEEAETLALVAELAWNVAERLRAQEAQRASQEHLRFVTDHAPILLVHCDRELRYAFANLRYTERFGLRPEDVIGMRVRDLMGDAAFESLRPQFDRALSGEQFDLDQPVPYPWGTRWMHCMYVPERDATGAVIGFVGAIEDVTERREAEERQRLSEERFRATFENAAVGIAHVDLTGRWLRVNDRLCRILGYSREDLLSRSFQDVTYPADLEADVAMTREVIAGKRERYAMDKRYVRGDGTLVWATLTVSLARKPDGSPDYFISVVQDITARKEVEAAFREADQRKDEFLALLAHELRNPLSPIRTSMALLRARPDPDPQFVRCRDVIERQVTHMARLLDDLLDVSRLSRGKLTLQRSRVAIADIIDAAIEANGPLITQRSQRVDVTGTSEEILVDADAARLTQVFGNLLNNAAKYSGEGATIHLEVTRDAESVVVTVRDSGIGIPPAMLEKVFDLFTQADVARTHAPGGLGIGLSLAQRLVEMHGGTIVAHSAGPGQGSEFTVRLPLGSSRAADAGPRLLPVAPRPGALERRVLVVDDNRDVADTHAMLLEASGFQVKSVYTGEAALQAFEQFRPDLVLLDLGLPDISGHDVCRRLRSFPGGGAATIVAVTGWGQARDRERSMAAGFDRHLVKPVDPEALIGIASATRRRRLRWPPREEA